MKLYDSAADVVRKAIVGHGIPPATLAAKAGISPHELREFLDGKFSPLIATSLAQALGLNARALRLLPEYQPDAPLPKAVVQVALPFGDEEVNVWFIESDDTRIVIDCGFRSRDLLTALESRSALTSHLLVTHAHRDHIGGLGSAMQKLSSAHAPSGIAGSKTITIGSTLEIGPFCIQAIDLGGHHPQALGYLIEGLGLHLLAVGDAIFAGSMGGCPDSEAFEHARKTIMATIAGAPDDLVLLPGHGPATRLKSELSANPFLAAWTNR